MKILGIDPGSRALGYGIINIISSKLSPVEYGVVKLDAKEELPVRLCGIYENVTQIIEKHKPDLISVETPFFGKNAHSSFVLGHARGAIMLAVGQSKTKYCEHSPTEIKKAVTGNGLAEKSQVEYMVKAILGLSDEKIKDDAFDALACAICGYNHFNSSR
ncbi:MAG: crossover junction endodeoxyribonuclease RuvC [Chitinivibrionia bacterium]|nr:crossover junction endodeoxyribonuclease RuvC [Chitinivibrionia bacterium]